MSVIDKIKLDGTTYDVGKTPDTTLAVSGSPADAAKVGTELDKKVDKVTGKGLSTEDFTTAEKTKLAGIAEGARTLTIDTTLTQSGQAADAKVIGEIVDNYLFSINLFDINSNENVSGYIANNGLIGTNANLMTSGYIAVKPNTKYYVSGGFKSPYATLTVPFLLEFLEDKTPSTFHTDVPYYFVTGSTTKYVRFTYRVGNMASGRVGLSELEIPVTGIPSKYNKQVNARKTSIPQAQIRIIQWKSDAVDSNVIMGNPGSAFSPRKNSRIAFSGSFSSFTNLVVGLAVYGGDLYNRLEITPTKVISYNSNGTITEYEHGLTIENNIQILLEIGFALNCNLTLVSNGVAFTQTNIRWDGKFNTYVYAIGKQTMSKCTLSWTSTDMNKSIWMFGDSYFGYTNHWAYWLNRSGYINNCMMNSYPGESSTDAIKALKTYLQIACPQKVVWCMGMNDGNDVDDTTPSTSWKTAFDELVLLSELFGFEIVVATIPTVPAINHEGQNYFVRNSGHRIIDFAAAVGSQLNGTWFSGMLSSDEVHPSATGAMALYMRFLADFPEIMIDDN